MKLSIRHTTQYDYDGPVGFALQKVRLRPQDNPLQNVVNWNLSVEGGALEARYSDHYGNQLDLVSADAGTQRLLITAEGTVETTDAAGVLGKVYGRAPLWHFAQATTLTKPGPKIAALAKVLDTDADDITRFHSLSAEILNVVPYEIGQTNAGTSAEDAVTQGKGVCQDHANIFISAARQAGFAARYVSGYLMMNDRVEQDASHAWAEVHLDGLGWVGFDVSNGVSPDGRYVRLAIGRDAHDAAPISGLRSSQADESMIVSLQVQQ